MIDYDHDTHEYIIPTFEQSVERLREFVSARSESKGGYAPVDKEDLNTIGDILNDLLHLKYEMDPDGDISVVLRLRDCTKTEGNHFQDLQHLDADTAPVEDLLHYFSMAELNLSIAHEQVKRAYTMFDWRLRQAPLFKAKEEVARLQRKAEREAKK
jgi:hypothetical protein